MTVTVARTWPTWTVLVDDAPLFTGIWRRKVAEALAETL